MAIYRLGDLAPRISPSAYVAPGAAIIGNVTLGERVSVWPGAVIRGDNDVIDIGDNSNIQDGAVLHVDPGFPMAIGKNVTIGHQAMLHGCTIGEGALVGIQAIVLNRVVVGRDCLVAAGALIAEGKVFPERTLIVGAPAKALRGLRADELAMLHANVESYLRRCERFRTDLQRID